MSLDTSRAVAVSRDLTAQFRIGYQKAKPFYPRLCTIPPRSKGSDEKYGGLGSVPGVRKWLGDRKFKQLRGAHFTIENETWEASLEIQKEDYEDDRLGMYMMLAQQQGNEVRFHPDELLLETMLANGDATTCWDGQYFFDTDHEWGDSGTQDNDLTYSCVSASAPTAAEFLAAYHQALETMIQYKNDQGKFLNRPVHTGLANLMVIVPPQLWKVANQALKSTLLGGGDSNIVLEHPEIVVSPHLSGSGVKWYLLNLGGTLRPFVFQMRRPWAKPQLKGVNDRETRVLKWMTDARYQLGYMAWWAAVQTTLTNA